MSVRCPQTNLQIRIIKKKSLRGRKDFQCRYVYQYQKLRAFNKIYGPSIAGESVKLHKRLKQYDTAANYNKVYGLTANRIEIKNGGKDKDPFILKVRVTGAFRKFFYHIVTTESLEFLKKKDWKGAFEEVSYIYVIEINNHDYNIK